ncbi:HK97 family phage prohead protease [Arthrobacter sp. RCC_34]|uniref:HK97 family phage prohead protease n=1 Tax=Arthrobacter sp. RCC_34 TaxID=3239230 RepID=UPI0035262284
MSTRTPPAVVTLAGHRAGLTASAKSRTISGAILQYGVVGYSSAGPTIFEAGSLTVPEPISKVKFLHQHDDDKPLGVMSSLTDAGEFLHASFTIPPGEDGDRALTEAQDGRRDGLSVGVQITEYAWDDNDNLIVKAARLHEVSQVTIPAFENALVSDVAASHGKDTTMPTTTTAPPAKPAPDTTATAAAQTPPPAPQTPPVTPPAPAASGLEVFERQAAPIVPANAGRGGMTLAAAAQKVIELAQAGHSALQITAALNDIVPADDAGEGYLRRQFIGELWQAMKDDRPIIDSFGRGKLTGTKVYGWKWDLENSPKVGKYAGNKQPVPSNSLKTIPVEGDAQDFAAGWDVARKYIDLGASGFIESVFRGAAVDYRQQTELWFGQQIIEAGTPLAGATSVLSALNAGAIAAAKIGASINVMQFGTKVWEDFINLKTADVPWWLQKQGNIEIDGLKGNAGGMSFICNVGLDDGQVLMADKRAATYYEDSSDPIRVQALDLPRGGVDLGVFGYAGAIVHDPRAILVADTTPAPPAG